MSFKCTHPGCEREFTTKRGRNRHERYHDSVVSKRLSEAQKKGNRTSEAKDRRVEASKKNWADPEYRAKLQVLGWHTSEKARYGQHWGKAYYRSEAELAAYKLLDGMKKVIWYMIEPFGIPYQNPETGRESNYYPDILVAYDGGSFDLVEVKPSDGHQAWNESTEKTAAKQEAARKLCEELQINFRMMN